MCKSRIYTEKLSSEPCTRLKLSFFDTALHWVAGEMSDDFGEKSIGIDAIRTGLRPLPNGKPLFV